MTINFDSYSPMSSHIAKADTIQTNRELGKCVAYVGRRLLTLGSVTNVSCEPKEIIPSPVGTRDKASSDWVRCYSFVCFRS